MQSFNLAIDKNQRARRDLNPRPTEPESVALSTEPRAQTLYYYSRLFKFSGIDMELRVRSPRWARAISRAKLSPSPMPSTWRLYHFTKSPIQIIGA
mgnify:FL=1